MTTDTADVKSAGRPPFNIDVARKELAEATARYDSLMEQLKAASEAGDFVTIVKLGGEMGGLKNPENTGKIDKLTKSIARAESGSSNYNLAEKIAARTAAFNALRDFFSSEASNPVRDMLAKAAVKVIKINVKDGQIDGFDVVGGFREVGVKRTRAIWVAQGTAVVKDEKGKITNGLSSAEVRDLYGVKHGATKATGDMSPAEKKALLDKIILEEAREGNVLVNVAAAE